ncbi:MAG: DUF6504 family protein [Dermatophilaceae bacterium]
MVRRYEEPIEVRAGAGAVAVAVGIDSAGGSAGYKAGDKAGDTGSFSDRTPSAFLWRGRLYVVRDVIGHWRERRAWWREVLDPDEGERGTAPGMSAAKGPDCLEQEVWRVEASPGRLAGTGVYDLGMNGPTRGWRLLRVAD